MTHWLSEHPYLLSGGFKGIEKESLRINAQGLISQTLHPHALGSTLTHSHITTDYSEALIELITPPFSDIRDTLNTLQNIHQFVHENLGDEQLLCASMPCGIDGDESIRIAEYGTSNIGRMKHVYRHGLWHRYGRTMQAIAGIHFNYSVPEPLWEFLHAQKKSPSIPLQKGGSFSDFKNAAYFGLIRNFQRIGWLILYLFGASSAICKNFFKSRPALMAQFEEFDNGTLYHPYATSLRMSDIGYKSKNQANLAIDYNTLDGYVNSLSAAISTPYPDYEKIGVCVNGEYKQLNANILQIENEFYSIMRPKQIALSGEKPTSALRRGGVEYVEMRALDLNPFHPLGIDEPTARFIEALLLTCLLTDSPEITADELRVNNSNQLIVANSGRKPNVELVKNGETITLQNWAREILDLMQPICEALDSTEITSPYSNALKLQHELVENSDLTPSAKMLATMRENKKPFASFAVNQSIELAKIFAAQTLDETTRQKFITLAAESHVKQRELEATPQLPFEQFLEQYFSNKSR
ncbi:MAG: glutamate--cysteine ligase [Methylococcales bacterium]|nr:glutamate--cysteine ligase [Methylococcales bacterium]MDD5753408.1 glutamate--cysteine ligase [Methylococcales bacterium]